MATDLKKLFGSMGAALIDMDGTILDTMAEWRQCNIDYLEARGVEMTPEQRQRVICSSSGALLIDYVRDELGVEVDIPAFRALQQERMMEVYRRGPRVKPGSRELLSALRERGVKTVLATATWADHTIVALNKCGLVSSFDALCGSHTIGCGKNTVDYFDKVSELIGVPKDRCVLFDDATYALKGARAAGLLGNVGVANQTNIIFHDEIASLSDIVVESLAEIVPLLPPPRR